jgi:hypothetical protein
LSAIYPSYKEGGFDAQIKILSGTVIDELLDFSDINLGWITIIAEDTIVDVFGSGPTSFIVGNNSILPLFLNIEFRATGTRSSGVFLVRSTLVFDGGFRDFNSGLTLTNNSYIESNNFFIRDGSGVGVSIKDSVGKFGFAQIRSMGSTGLLIDNSKVTIPNSIISTNAVNVVIKNQSIVDLSLATIVNSQFSPEISITGGSNVNMKSADFTPSNNFLSVLVLIDDSKVIMDNINFDEPSLGNANIVNESGDLSIMQSSRFNISHNNGAMTKTANSSIFTSPATNVLTSDGIIFN